MCVYTFICPVYYFSLATFDLPLHLAYVPITPFFFRINTIPKRHSMEDQFHKAKLSIFISFIIAIEGLISLSLT